MSIGRMIGLGAHAVIFGMSVVRSGRLQEVLRLRTGSHVVHTPNTYEGSVESDPIANDNVRNLIKRGCK